MLGFGAKFATKFFYRWAKFFMLITKKKDLYVNVHITEKNKGYNLKY